MPRKNSVKRYYENGIYHVYSRYIHRNPDDFTAYAYSSYGDYSGTRQTDWVNTTVILNYFLGNAPRKTKNYQQFVDESVNEPIDLSSVVLEGDG